MGNGDEYNDEFNIDAVRFVLYRKKKNCCKCIKRFKNRHVDLKKLNKKRIRTLFYKKKKFKVTVCSAHKLLTAANFLN